jgi:hypothetical protein
MNRNRQFGWALLMVIVLGCASCERNTRISFAGDKNPPIFSLHGNGTLNFFWVSEVDAAQPIPEDVRTMVGKDRLIWEIWPTNVPDTSIGELPKITYGKIPHGFTQKIPVQMEPPLLIEGKIYEARGPSSSANMEVFRYQEWQSYRIRFAGRTSSLVERLVVKTLLSCTWRNDRRVSRPVPRYTFFLFRRSLPAR